MKQPYFHLILQIQNLNFALLARADAEGIPLRDLHLREARARSTPRGFPVLQLGEALSLIQHGKRGKIVVYSLPRELNVGFLCRPDAEKAEIGVACNVSRLVGVKKPCRHPTKARGGTFGRFSAKMLYLLHINAYLAGRKGANKIPARVADAEKQILSLWKTRLSAIASRYLGDIF